MPDFHELLDESIGTPPPFDLGALARRRRRHRQRQVGTLAGVVAVLAAVSGAFALGRASSDRPAAIETHNGTSTTIAGPTTTVSASTTTSATHGTVAVPPPQGGSTTSSPQPTSAAQPSTNPGADDFDGILVAAPTSATVGQPVTVAWAIRNVTGHAVVPVDNPTLDSEFDLPNPDVVALVCAPLGTDGLPSVPLGPGNLFVPSWSAPLAPGSGLGDSETYTPTTDVVGTVTCEVVILDRAGGLSNLSIVDRVHAIAPVTITVSDTGTTTTTTAPTTTTTS